MADNLDEKQLRENIAEIIKNGDLGSLTSKKIRQILEKKYDANLSHRKKQIDDIVMQLVDEQSDDSDNNAESSSKSDSGKKSSVEELSEKEAKSPVKSERVSVISVNNKQKRKGKSEESDSDAEDELQSESESDSDYDAPKPKRKSTPSKRSAAKSKEKSKAAKKPKTEKGEGGKKKTGFAMPMLLSPELADLMGETHMARSEVVKKMWQIIKERDLLDPTNKRFTICDDQLEKIIGKKRFLTFAMMKYLKRHVIDPALV